MASIAQVTVRFGADLKDFSTKMQRANREMMALGRSMQNTGRDLTRNVTLPIIAIGAASTKLALDFDTSMTKIQTLVGLSTDTVEGFKKSVLDIAGRTAQAPAALADALFTVTSAGLRGAASLEVLEMAAKGSAVGMGETREIAKAVTAVMQAYGPEVMSAAKAMDILTATVREGNLEASELAPVLGRVVGVAAQMGVGFDQIGSSIATFTRLGVDSAEAVTGLSGFLGAMIKPSEEGKRALEAVGMSFAGLREEIKTKGLAATMIGLIQTFDGNVEALGDVIPNVRALATVMGTAGAQGKQYLEIQNNIANSTGILNKAFEDTAESGAFQFRAALATLQQVGTEIGNILLPVLANVAKKVKELISGFSNLNPETQVTIIKVAALAAAVGPLLLGVGSLITGFGALLGTLKTVGLFLSTNPYFALAGAVAAVTLAIISYNSLSRKFNETSRSASNAIQEEKVELNNLVGAITNVNNTNESRAGLLDELNQKYPDFLSKIDKETISNDDLLGKLKDVNAEYEKRILQQLAQEDKTVLLAKQVDLLKEERDILKTIAGLRDEDGNAQKQGGMMGFEGVDPTVGLTQKLEHTRKKIKEVANEFQTLNDFYDGIIPKAEQQTTELGNTLTVQKAITGEVKKQTSEFTTQAEALDELASILKRAYTDVQQANSDRAGLLDSLLSDAEQTIAMFDNLGGEGTDLLGVNKLTEDVLTFKDVANNAFNSIGDIINGVFTDMFSGAKVTFTGIIKLITQLIAKLAAAAITAAILTVLLPGGTSKTGEAISKGSQFASLFKNFAGFRAGGGPVASGSSYIVGEKGPELFTPGNSGNITPNNMLGGGGGGSMSIQFVGSIPLVWNGQGLSGMINQENIRVKKFGG